MPRKNFKLMTAREIREIMPDPDTLNMEPIPGKLRRELYRAMKQHAPNDLAELCNAHNATAGNLIRDQYFQFAKVLEFPIHEWLAREAAVLDKFTREKRQRDTSPARVAKGKLGIAVAMLESLGYAWHGASNKFVKIPVEPIPDQNWD